ncbi:MAG: nuclear transport factor 2 family protein [Sphingobacteriales bacterium]|nr:nuclear transport factor 2 family protein [Sphingobacteriales bacterium]MBI3720090.1 nuclear transport factor 2 family protein [Sphingobacteriales bacterium]
MFQNVIILSIVLLSSATVKAQTVNKKQVAVQQTVENMFTALSNTDTAALKIFVTNNVRLYEYGQVWTIDTLIRKIVQARSIPDFKRTNSFEFVNTSIHQKTAWVTYYLQSIITRNGKEETVNWMETVILLKEKDQWKINVLHSTRLINN